MANNIHISTPSTGLAPVIESECEVCKQEKETHVRSSKCGPISFAYCTDCLQKGAEPYGAIVAYLAGAVDRGSDLDSEKDMIHPSYQKVIDISLEIVGKTRDQLYTDVDASIREYEKFLLQMESEPIK